MNSYATYSIVKTRSKIYRKAVISCEGYSCMHLIMDLLPENCTGSLQQGQANQLIHYDCIGIASNELVISEAEGQDRVANSSRKNYFGEPDIIVIVIRLNYVLFVY